MRTNLKVFRVQNGLTQEQMALRIGYKRATYSAIESGARSGKHDFWEDLQETFDISDSEMWRLMHND